MCSGSQYGSWSKSQSLSRTWATNISPQEIARELKVDDLSHSVYLLGIRGANIIGGNYALQIDELRVISPDYIILNLGSNDFVADEAH